MKPKEFAVTCILAGIGMIAVGVGTAIQQALVRELERKERDDH